MARSQGLITDEDWYARKVDMHCLDCGAMSAGSSRCYRCGSSNIELRTHAQTPVGDILWCRGFPKTEGRFARTSD